MTHDQANPLLPWLANQSLGDAERGAVEEHVEGCPECATELSELRALAATAQALSAAAPAPPPELRATAMRRVERLEVRRPGAVWRRIAAAFAAAPGWSRLAMAGQLLVIALLVALSADRGTVVAGAGSGDPQAGSRIVVQFEPTVSEAELRALLVELDARLVGGPSAQGFYTLAFATDDAATVDELAARLRSRSALVRYAERQP